MQKSPIYVTQPSLPPLDEFLPLLKRIWESKVLTNGGPLHQQLENTLCEHLGVHHIALFNNGTAALITALKALGITGEVITTPYTFVATTHALRWSGLDPVFVDIDPATLNIDPAKIEAAITERTTAILPVHCYGTPCDAAAIKKIADAHGLHIIYDAAHAFGVRDDHGSILRHGELSVLSFHATKVFSTFEGGAIVCHDAEMRRRLNQMKNFGFVDEVTVDEVGINGKMNEVSAAFGLVQLAHMPEALNRRKHIDHVYRAALQDAAGIRLLPRSINPATNYGYFPILVEDAYPLTRDQLYLTLRNAEIYARRYFYPLTSEFPMYADLPSASASNLPIATRVARQVICLPTFPDMTEEQLARVIGVILQAERRPLA